MVRVRHIRKTDQPWGTRRQPPRSPTPSSRRFLSALHLTSTCKLASSSLIKCSTWSVCSRVVPCRAKTWLVLLLCISSIGLAYGRWSLAPSGQRSTMPHPDGFWSSRSNGRCRAVPPSSSCVNWRSRLVSARAASLYISPPRLLTIQSPLLNLNCL